MNLFTHYVNQAKIEIAEWLKEESTQDDSCKIGSKFETLDEAEPCFNKLAKENPDITLTLSRPTIKDKFEIVDKRNVVCRDHIEVSTGSTYAKACTGPNKLVPYTKVTD